MAKKRLGQVRGPREARRRPRHGDAERARQDARDSSGEEGGGRIAHEGAASLPPVDQLSHVPRFDDLLPSEGQLAAFDEVLGAHPEIVGEVELGFVCRLDRGFPAVRCASGLYRAEHAQRIFKEDLEKPAVGDCVVLGHPRDHDMALLGSVLPRVSELARWRGGPRGERQVLAANVSRVVVVCPLGRGGAGRDGDLVDAIARAAVVAEDCGCSWALVLTKADRLGDPDELRAIYARLREVFGDGVPMAALGLGAPDAPDAPDARGGSEGSAIYGGLGGGPAVELPGLAWGPDGVRELLGTKRTSLMLGRSGVGKSTLLNALVGEEVLATGATRVADDAGRHTTVARRMVRLAGGEVVIDCPGLRSLPLLGHGAGLARVFPDVAERAMECRFKDCAHEREPGCAVRGAVEEGLIPPARVECFVRLAREMAERADALEPDVRLSPTRFVK